MKGSLSINSTKPICFLFFRFSDFKKNSPGLKQSQRKNQESGYDDVIPKNV